VDGKPRNFIFIDPERDSLSILDAAKAADIIIPVLSTKAGDPGFDVDGMSDHIVTLVKAQGLPSVVGVTTLDTKSTNNKKNTNNAIRLCKRWFQSAFDGPRIVTLDNENAVDHLLRYCATTKLTDITWRSPRSYMVSEKLQFRPTTQGKGSLLVTGYLRGQRGLSARQLVHITGVDDFQIGRIYDASIDPARSKKKLDKPKPGMEQEMKQSVPVGGVLSESRPEERTSLESLNPIDTAAQNIITEEELVDAETELKIKHAKLPQPKPAMPPGMEGVIQDVWRQVVSDDEDEPDAARDLMSRIRDHNASATTPSEIAIGSEIGGMDTEDLRDEDATLAKLRSTMAEEKLRKEQGYSLEELEQQEKDEMEWPDELEVHPDVIAKNRFAKFRGLKNFRTTEWDAKQMLPMEYGQIFQFQNFEAARRRVLSGAGGGCGGEEVETGRRVAIEVLDIPTEVARSLCEGERPVLLWGLFLYERKVSVGHFLVKRHDAQDSLPVRAKAPMIISAGFRRFKAKPIYSQDCKSNKFKTDRFLRTGVWGFASFYCRMILTPSTILMFREKTLKPAAESPDDLDDLDEALPQSAVARLEESYDPYRTLMASGTLASIDPDRLLIKRVLLTGAPISVSKRLAVVRHMFFRPEDVRWFKPVELWTKHGLTGHILDAHGTKGYMKCSFNGHIKNHDTVCMSLYKRQYPPFEARDFDSDAWATQGTAGY